MTLVFYWKRTFFIWRVVSPKNPGQVPGSRYFFFFSVGLPSELCQSTEDQISNKKLKLHQMEVLGQTETGIALEHGWLEDCFIYFPSGKADFQRLS